MAPRALVASILLLLWTIPMSTAQRRTLESEHFVVSYPAEIEESARSCLRIAEETADTLAPFFGYVFGGPRIVLDLHDESDFSNGAARIRQRYVRLDLRKTRSLWRGETDWLRNVLAHELSHTYTIAVLKRPLYLWVAAALDVEEAEGDGTMGIEHNRMPHWFLEGLSQLGALRFGADRRDPYREMLLRDAWLDGRLLSLSEMARFELSSRERELVYNQGFSFVLFVAETHPEVEMSRFLAAVRYGGLDAAARGVLGASLERLYDRWTASLTARYGTRSPAAGAPARRLLYGDERHPLTLEASATADGRYVIANWGEDYQAYSLYERRGDGLRLVRRDTGTVLRQDPANGSVWFNALVYKPGEDEAQLELFRIDGSGRPKQVLEGTRCRAFDVRGGRVAFASYAGGITSVESLDAATGKREVLQVLPPGAAVYDIALTETGEILASVGDGARIRLFSSGAGGTREVWPGTEADITSPLPLGGDRLAFCSTLDGTPQLYAASLGARQWERLSQAPACVTAAVAWDAGSAAAVCSVYGDGSLKLERLPVSGGAPVAVGPSPAAAAADPPPDGAVGAARRGAALVPSIPTVMLGYGVAEDVIDFDRAYVNTLTAGADVDVTSSCGKLELSLAAGLDVTLGEGDVDSVQPFALLRADLLLSPGTLSQTLQTWGYSRFGGESSTAYAVDRYRVLLTQTDYSLPLTLRTAVLLGYRYRHQLLRETAYVKNEGWVFSNGKSSMEILEGPLYGRHDVYASLELADARQTYDPARLGTPGAQLRLGATGTLVSYYDRDALGVSSADDPSTAVTLSGLARGTAVPAGRRVSATAQVRGSGTVLREVPDVVTPYLYPSVGTLGLATGYEPFYPAWAYAQGEVDVRVSPFHYPFDGVRWYERFSLGFRVEGGAVWTVDRGSLDIGWPLTLEAALRCGILLTARREASLFLRVAFPMLDKDFFDTDWDYRVYFGASL